MRVTPVDMHGTGGRGGLVSSPGPETLSPGEVFGSVLPLEPRFLSADCREEGPRGASGTPASIAPGAPRGPRLHPESCGRRLASRALRTAGPGSLHGVRAA